MITVNIYRTPYRFHSWWVNLEPEGYPVALPGSTQGAAKREEWERRINACGGRLATDFWSATYEHANILFESESDYTHFLLRWS